MASSLADVYPRDLILLSGWDAKIIRRFPHWSSSPPKPRKKSMVLKHWYSCPPILLWLLQMACVLTGTFLVQDILGPQSSVSGDQCVSSRKPGKSAPEDKSSRVSNRCTTKISLWTEIEILLVSTSCFWWIARIRQCPLHVCLSVILLSGWSEQKRCPLDSCLWNIAFLLFPACRAAGLQGCVEVTGL